MLDYVQLFGIDVVEFKKFQFGNVTFIAEVLVVDDLFGMDSCNANICLALGLKFEYEVGVNGISKDVCSFIFD